jgi:hypothetical protein
MLNPVDVHGFDVIAVWHPRVDEDIAHRWLRSHMVKIAKLREAKVVPTAVIQPLHWVDDGCTSLTLPESRSTGMLVLRGLAVGGCERSAGRHCASTTLSAAKEGRSQAAFLVIET